MVKCSVTRKTGSKTPDFFLGPFFGFGNDQFYKLRRVLIVHFWSLGTKTKKPFYQNAVHSIWVVCDKI